MSATSGPADGDTPYSGARASGWIAFAAIMLIHHRRVSASSTASSAILNDQQVAKVGSGHGVVIWDATAGAGSR